MVNKLKKYNIVPSTSDVYAISIVDEPAVESNFIALSKQRPLDFKIQNEERRIVYGCALRADFDIYRKYGDEEFYVTFSKDAVRRLMTKFMKNFSQKNWTKDHMEFAEGLTVVESWLVEDVNNDKANKLGLENFSEGSWMIGVKVDDDEIWKSNLYKCPDIFKHFLELNYGKQEYDFDNIDDEVRQYKDITLYPRKYLIPFSPAQIRKEDIRKISEDTYTIHWYKGSWSKPEIFYFLENKNKYNLSYLDEKCKQIKTKSEKGFQYNNIFERIFSIKDSYKKSKKYRIFTIFGIQIKHSVKL